MSEPMPSTFLGLVQEVERLRRELEDSRTENANILNMHRRTQDEFQAEIARLTEALNANR